MYTDAVPDPEPTPVATNVVPTVFEAAPIAVKLVVPKLTILYSLSMTNDPADIKVPTKDALAVV